MPREWLDRLNPDLVVIGEAPSDYLDYYRGYNIITQNSAGDVLFDTATGKIHIYVEDSNYYVDYLANDGLDVKDGLYYVGTLYV